MSFLFKLPVDADEEGATGFPLQNFDADVLYNDMLCEESFKLDAFFRRAYKSKLPTSYFPRQSNTKLHDLNTAGVGFEPMSHHFELFCANAHYFSFSLRGSTNEFLTIKKTTKSRRKKC
jgi:hypothetical protein